MIRKALTPFVLLPVIAAPLAAQQQAAHARLCLTPTRHGTVGTSRNYAYDGVVTVDDDAPRAGYWVVALEGGGLDAGGQLWAQNGGGVGPDGGDVRFGISNASQYPLTFAVVRLPSDNEYRALRDAATQGRALPASYLHQIVSDLSLCTFDLDPPNPQAGVPVNTPGGGSGGNSCACPDR